MAGLGTWARQLETALIQALGDRRRTIGERSYRVGRAALPRPPREADWEPWIDAVYGAALDLSPGAAIDVGVNKMQTLFKLLSIDPARRYVGFEPQLPAAMAAHDFIRRNGLEAQATLVCAGLSEDAGAAVLRMRRGSGFEGDASIADLRPGAYYGASQVIPLLRGDDAVSALGLGPVALLKIDVEGAELEVLRGFPRLLASGTAVAVFEVLNDWRPPGDDPEAQALSARKDDRAAEISELLSGAGLRLYHVERERIVPVARIERRVSDDLGLCHYAAAPAALADRFEAACAARMGA